MSTMYGADVAQLRHLASQFDAKAQALDANRMTVGNAIQVSAWVGPVAVRFRHTWESDYSRKLHDAAVRLRDAATRLRANADQQEKASAVDAGASRPGGVPGGGGGASHGGGATSGGSGAGEQIIRVPRLNGETVVIKNGFTDTDGPRYSTEEEARSGGGGSAGLHAGGDGKGGYDAGADAKGEYGIGSSTTTRMDGSVVDGEVGVDNFAGARGHASAGAHIGLDGASANVGAGGFAGSEIGAHGKVDVGGVQAGMGASLRAGIGAEASGSAKIDAEGITLKAKIGLSLGVGGSIEPSIQIRPKEILQTIQNIFKWPH